MLRTWGKYDAERSPADRWQNRIAVFTASHYHEKAQRRSWQQPGTEPDPEMPDEGPTALELVEDASQRQHARALIQQIPPELRDVLTRYLAGVPIDEIAAELPALKKALAKVATEERAKEATLRAKPNAMRKSDKSFGQGAALLAASFTFAGLEDLAAKVRPSGRRPGRTAAEEDDALPVEEPASPEPALPLEGG